MINAFNVNCFLLLDMIGNFSTPDRFEGITAKL